VSGKELANDFELREIFMSETMKTLIESLLMIGAISAGFVWYAVVAGRRENRDARSAISSAAVPMVPASKTGRALQDPDAHLGRCGAE
jgi:predicted anti-sigma-YlaC factor YlaD